jgi:hypothetical protein
MKLTPEHLTEVLPEIIFDVTGKDPASEEMQQAIASSTALQFRHPELGFAAVLASHLRSVLKGVPLSSSVDLALSVSEVFPATGPSGGSIHWSEK